MVNNILELYNNIDSVSVSDAHVCDPEDCLKFISNSKRHLKLIVQNIRSAAKNLEEFQIFISRLGIEPEVIVLTECWTSKLVTLPHIDNYTAHHTINNLLQNDGVIVYMKNNLNTVCYEPNFAEGNCLVTIINNSIVIVSIYRSPSYNNTEVFLQSLDNVLQKLQKYKNILVVGDMNINIVENSTDRRAADYIELMASHGLLASHNFPTRQMSCLDHIFLKTTQNALSLVVKNSITDHYSLVVALKGQNYKKNTNTVAKQDYDKIKDEIATVDFGKILDSNCSNTATNLLIDTIQQIVKKHTKIIKFNKKKIPIKPWVTPGILRCLRHRDSLHAKLRASPTDMTLVVVYKRYRNHCTNILKKLKIAYEKNELEKAGKDTKKTWEVIGNITNHKKKKVLPQDLVQGSQDPIAATENVNIFFANVGKQLAEKFKSDHDTMDIDYSTESSKRCNSFALIETDEQEVETIIKSLKTECSIGWDDISTQVIKQNMKHLIAPITHICNLSFKTAVFPKALKKSVILPIYKNGDKSSVTNYRPISILPVLSKILERLMNNRLVKYLEKYDLLASNQYGFRRGRSTSDAVSNLNDYIVKALDQGEKCLAIFLDLSKAFDTVSVPLLLQKLERLGVRDKQLKLFESYLGERYQCVKIGNYTSSDQPVSYGVPQGSILGPTLFLTYINDICQTRIDNGKVITFADDTALIFKGKSWVEVFKDAQTGFDKVSDALAKNLLTINPQKTKYLKFSLSKRTLPDSTLQLLSHDFNCSYKTMQSCQCTVLECCQEIKYLGIIIDSKLSYRPHINQLVTRVRKLIAVFKNIRHAATAQHLTMIYYALCYSLLTYCITVWGGACKTHLLPLERAQRAVLKVGHNKPFRYSTFQLYKDWQVLTVRQIFIYHTFILQHRKTPYDAPMQSHKRRKGKVDISTVRTSFAQKHNLFLSAYIYNKINNINPMFHLRTAECKNKIKTLLFKLNYTKTEDILNIPT